MSTPPQDEHRNLLLRRMDASHYQLLAPHLRPFDGRKAANLFYPGDRIEVAYFLTDGVISLVAISPEGHQVEAGLFGREGFGPVGLAMGDDRAPFKGTVQLPGAGYTIATDALQAALEASVDLRTFLLKFAHVFGIQAGFTALSNAVHPIEERLARWLLMRDDRVSSGELELTHEFLSIMLAVRRPSVTTALHVLEGNGFIHAQRGVIAVRNRAALETFAGDAYGKPEAEYERLLGSRT